MKQLLTILIVTLILNGVMAEPQPTGSFQVYDIVIDSGSDQLAAWQFTLSYDNKHLKLVGIEGGDSASFPSDKPPFHDPKGLTAGKIILANFSLSKELNTGKQTVAKLHIYVKPDIDAAFHVSDIVASNPKGEKIDAKINMIRQHQPKE